MAHVVAATPAFAPHNTNLPPLTLPEPSWAPNVTPCNMSVKEWSFEMRREAQEVVPGLFLGSLAASADMNKLRQLGITHILCLRDHLEARFVYPRFPTEFRYMTMDIADSGAQNLITVFPPCRAFIDEALSCGGAILVHCNSGISTAPAIVVGYLMEKFGWDYYRALAYTQSKRGCVSPSNFENQLREYSSITAAQHAMSSLPKTATASHDRKRGWDGEGYTPDRRRRRSSDDDMDED